MSTTVKPNTCPKCGAAIPAGAPQGLCPKCVMAGAATATESGVAATATGEIPSLERVAAAFPQLEILELIGRGGMGFVFKARQPSLDRLVALKLLPDKLAKDASFTERFNREGRVLGRLNHANIVSIYDFGQTGGFYFLLMEYVDGVNLRQAMRAGRFSPAEALAIVPKVCEALQYAHEQGVLHRDIKPENILLDAKGRVKIADFGIAKLVDDSPLEITLTGTGAALGTPHYMAPEQLEKPSTVDHRADIYSLGVVFYEMLTGELPIGRFAAPSSKTPVGANVDEVVFRTLAKEPGDRYQSAGEVQTRVQTLADEASAAEHRDPASPPIGAPMGPHGTVVLGDAAPVKRPAQALLVAGIFNWVGSIAVVCLLAFTGLGKTWPLAPAELGVVCLLILGFSSVIIAGALKMRRLESYRLAIAASVVAMITSPGSIIGLPIGLWALLTLRQPKVRAAFKGVAARSSEIRFSRWSIYGAMLVGLSLPAPMRILVLMLTPGGGVGATDLWIALGSVAMPGLGGTLLGWLGLNEIRESRGDVRGLPLAMFATLMWPLSIIGGVAVGVPMFLVAPAGEPTATHLIGRFLVLLLPAGVITFAFWAIHATARWAGRQTATQQRGLLKWVFIAILVIGMGVVMAIRPVRQVHYVGSPPSPRTTAAPQPVESEPMIQFTFTDIEVREDQGARWLSLDYVQQIQGACERTFRTESTVPDFKFTTRTSESLVQGDKRFEPVRRQRVEWKLPDTLSEGEVAAYREQVAKQWEGKSVVVEPGGWETLFTLAMPDGATKYSGAIGVRLSPDDRAQGNTRQGAVPPSKTAASAELWAPNPAPGEKPKAYEILQESSKLAQEGQYEEALQRHIWYHNHALEVQPSQAGVRLSFALMQWVDLARRYPKAKEALVEIRDRNTSEFSSSGGSFRDFVEISFINKALGEDYATIAMFKSIQERDPKLAQECYQLVADLLVEQGEYALSASFITDVHERFERIRANREKMLRVARDPKSPPGLLRQEADRVFIKETRTLVEILVGVGRKGDAENIRDDAVSILDVAELRSAVDDAEVRVRKTTAGK